MPLILGRSGIQYVAMVTKLLSSYCVALLVEPYCMFRTEIWCVVDWVRVGKQTKKLDVRVEERMCNLLIYVVFME